MAVRLQTTEGKIKKYKTVYGVGNSGGGEHSAGVPEKYVANCGLEWKNKPSS